MEKETSTGFNVPNHFIKNFKVGGKRVFTNMHTIAHEMSAAENGIYSGRPVSALLSTLSTYFSGQRTPSRKTQQLLVASVTQAAKKYLVTNKLWEQDPVACEKFISDLGTIVITATDISNGNRKMQRSSQVDNRQLKNSMLENCIAAIQQADKLVCLNIPLLPHTIREQNDISAALLGEIAEKIAACKELETGSVEFQFGRNFSVEQEPLLWATLYALVGEEIVSLHRVETETKMLEQKARVALKERCSFSFTSTTASYTAIVIPGIEEYYIPKGKYGKATTIVRR